MDTNNSTRKKTREQKGSEKKRGSREIKKIKKSVIFNKEDFIISSNYFREESKVSPCSYSFHFNKRII